jgi:voltage-gated potassium channel
MSKTHKIKDSHSPQRPFISARDQAEEEEEANPLILSPSSATDDSFENNNGTKIKKKKHKSPFKSTLKPILKSLPGHHLKKKSSRIKSVTNSGGVVNGGDQQQGSIDVSKDEENTDLLATPYATMPPLATKNEEMINFAQFDAAEMGNYESLSALPSPTNEDFPDEGHLSQIKEELRHSSRSNISEASNRSLGSFFTGLKHPLSSIKLGFGGPPRLGRGKQPKRSGKELWALARSRLPDITMMHVTSMDDEDTEGDIGESVTAEMDIKLSTCVYGILLYLMLGTVFYSFVFERWSIVDSLYFSVVTFTTVGYGDYTPSTHAARLFTSAFALMGISFLGLALGVIGDKVLAIQLETVNKEMGDRNASRVLKVFGSGQASSNVALPVQDGSADAPLHETARKLKKEEVSCWSGFLYYVPVVALLFGGSAVIGWTEGWNWSQAIYYCTITTTTIGTVWYGGCFVTPCFLAHCCFC